MKIKRWFTLCLLVGVLFFTSVPSTFSESASGSAESSVPNVTIVAMGGTITSTAVGREMFQSYGSERVSIQNILDRLEPEISKVANVRIKELDNIGSAQTTTEHLYNLSLAIDEVLADQNTDAVVVTAGTNIMEELAYFADLTVRSPKPVVFTGSMRQSNTFSFDGEANLFNAIRLAASQETTCYGTVLMMNDEFFAAREVTKTDAVRLDTFDGGRYGALGTVDEDRIRSVRAPARVMECGQSGWKTPFDLSTIKAEDIAKVEIVYSYTEASGLPIKALVDAGVDGIVTAGHGAGGISTEQQAARAEGVEKGVVFVTTTRTGSGAVYDAKTPGIIGGGDLLPQKARILLQLGLTFSDNPEQVRQWFTTMGLPEFNMSR
ncbi:asparaginase [Paenibacillus macerans]|uniref:Asparaginase n=1 Tax=Paenibacillus macerans TaxID=44252 RepID=A0A090Z7F5_PAEMA|nr:asparaginase [Paenibacillus macerans]KFN06557.1 L-asparaginase 2 [Paenibacillus macerans]MBS5909123.1 asparaginase [Paenibacillus macerans]MCY7558140.1 asparaginase [Paenibacillus macerans]MDU5949171.1 asparaginase [Paenibacillus macerans]MEC0139985.1 asparaginase [Paenibacillus macerans]